MMIRSLLRVMAVALTLMMVAQPVSADRDRNKHDQSWKAEKRDHHNKRHYEKRGYKYDKRHRHNRYYPPRGHRITTLPETYHLIPHHGVDYYYHSGSWYHRTGISFSVLLPPIGIVIPVLPPYYTTIWVGATPYYYAGGVYYAWRPRANGYMVVEAPNENEVAQETDVADDLFIYPKEKQNEEQQATDRYQCYRWAVEQTRFDPTQPGGNVPVEQHASKRADYQRAMKACLEGRGYSVK